MCLIINHFVIYYTIYSNLQVNYVLTEYCII